jgi:phage FluMu gp28-like protein
MERCRQLVRAVAARKLGGRARRLCIDGTNERYFAQTVRDTLGAEIPVEIIIGSETIEIPGKEEKLTMKQFLGGLLVAELDDNHLTLPPERYIKDDFRLVKKDRGQFVCEPDTNGRHGDTFDGSKYANRALTSTGGALESVEGIRMGGDNARLNRPQFQPRRLR